MTSKTNSFISVVAKNYRQGVEMFKIVYFVTSVVLATVAAAPGIVTETHSIGQDTATSVVHTNAASAITHQSFTKLGDANASPVHPQAAATTQLVRTTYTAAVPVVKTVAAPAVKTVSAPVVRTYSFTPVNHAYAATPIVYATPVSTHIQDFDVSYPIMKH
ncbi:uncharacterized protein [Musca autumnalis]|uniref:uncharacterized protein n=1 Tax=Musca autumnalis TaxID=221902 RepID=UPI003CE891F2